MEINILIEEGLKVALEIDWLQNILEKVLIAEKSPSNAEISLVITSQERIRELNREYRGKDRPTDVLSFSMAEEKIEEEPAGFIVPLDGLIHLGEVIISYPQAVIQASERRHSLKNEMAILITHGVLHILGYDHEKPEMEPTMQARETEILGSIQKEIL